VLAHGCLYLSVCRSLQLSHKHVETLHASLSYLITLLFYVSITDNIGAHRKLLPLLARHWQQDVVIVTADDDTLYATKFLSSFIQSYLRSNKSAIIASRVRSISFCGTYPHLTLPYVYWNKKHCDSVKNELLVLPTGVGGVLYR
jgi:hypothetical protein